ncbi:MAG: hypothetical protein K9G38_02860 [Bacteroidales bacterium]|nr:hypothetical protein [Bacteroidales bacterium]
MKVINTTRYLMIALLAITFSCEQEEREVYSNADGRFVRFNLQVDKNGDIVQSGQINPAATPVSLYDQANVESLQVPVTITSEPLEKAVEVYFSYETEGDYVQFTVSPASGLLTFSGTTFTEHITIDYMGRWDAEEENQIELRLDSVSNDFIVIGNLNNLEKNDVLTINLAPLRLRYGFPTQNSAEVLGEQGETAVIRIEFPDGLFPEELEEQELIIPGPSEFAYSITREPFDADSREINYLVTLEETMENDLFSYQAGFTLAELDDYYVSGNTSFTITKPIFVERDNGVNTASHFYNVKDALYRTYGENWMDFDLDGFCEWRAFNTFTYPVEVSSDHPNAVFHDDNGTPEPEDDVYFHAFRVGFNSPNAGLTTNSFNLKRWFDNESNSAEYSSGFNIPQALEFYPENGDSETSGTVLVIPQDLIVATKVDTDVYRSHTIAIEGEGVYTEIAEGIFEIVLELRATNEDLFGGTRTSFYRIYNTSSYDDPVDITDGCFQPMDL